MLQQRSAMICEICHSDAWQPVADVPDVRYGRDDVCYHVVRCSNCYVMATMEGNVIVNPWSHYPEQYGAFTAPVVTGKPRIPSRTRLPIFKHAITGRLSWLDHVSLEPNQRVLEVGCGTGRISSYLKAALDWDMTGIEPNPEAAAIARDAGLNVYTGTLEDYEGDGLFDIVILIHVLEHLTNPAASMKAINGLLKVGGKLVIAVPNAGSVERKLFTRYWDGWDIPRHVYNFDPKSLAELLARTGFAPSQARFECYSLLGRSVANKFLGHLDYNVRKHRFQNRLLERVWGVFLAVIKCSSAIQIVAERKASPLKNKL